MTTDRLPWIELVYFAGCPHVESARTSLREALAEAGLPAQWTEWDQYDSATPPRVLGFGSPTILIGGRDVTGHGRIGLGKACRADGVPSVEVVRSALARTHPADRTEGRL